MRNYKCTLPGLIRILTSIFVDTPDSSCPHGTTSNKAFTLVWNRGVKGQSLLMILFLSSTSLAASEIVS